MLRFKRAGKEGKFGGVEKMKDVEHSYRGREMDKIQLIQIL